MYSLAGGAGDRLEVIILMRADLFSRPALHALAHREAIEKLAKVFDDKGAEVQANRDAEVTKLHAKIGQLVVERDFLAKAFDR
jgi:hypothetical protein